MEYYIIQEGIQTGPFQKEMLRMQGLSRDTFVWRKGLADWVKAGDLPELADVIDGGSAFGAYTAPEEPAMGYNPPPRNPYGQPNPYGQQNWNRGEQRPHVNWLPWAVIGTVFGAFFSCIGLIFGVIGISNASKANRYYAEGWTDRGDMANSSAKTMTIVALVLGGIGFLLTVTGQTQQLLMKLLEMSQQ